MNSENDMKTLYQKAADYILQADALLITAGAGMGVDSGLPDFRGTTGFWKAYPALGQKGMTFEKIAHPDNFQNDPKTAWGFYGHRLNLYREIEPHAGFQILKEIGERMPNGYFVYTSNVDGQFQKAGFSEEKIIECHGSIHYLQCSEMKSGNACKTIWPADELIITTDDVNCQSTSPLPVCPHCGSVARPNILMFYDFAWLSERNYQQQIRYDQFLQQAGNLVIIEMGAGTAIPTVRQQGDFQSGALIRINPREPDMNKTNGVSIPMEALESIQAIFDALNEITDVQQIDLESVHTPCSENSKVMIVSGGQTGVDRAALDAALELNIPCGGWCPEGRKAEDGVISEKYPLVELQQSGYRQRTKRNVVDSDGTVIIYFKYLTGGTQLTLKFCLGEKKPYLLIDATELTEDKAAQRVNDFVQDYNITKLNFAGPRGSCEPNAYGYTKQVVSGFIHYQNK